MKKLAFFAVLIFLFLPSIVSAKTFKTPVILDINQDIKSFDDVFIHGYTEIGTEVELYIDGFFVSKVNIQSQSPAVNNFYFKLTDLPNYGKHTAFVLAKGLYIRGVSAPSPEFEFFISHSLDAPVVVSTQATKDSRVEISLEAESRAYTMFYIDNQYDGRMFLGSTKGGLDIFKYISKRDLAPGDHIVWVTVLDEVGRSSGESNSFKFNIPNPGKAVVPIKTHPVKVPTTPTQKPVQFLPKITPEAATEEKTEEIDGALENIEVRGIEKIPDTDLPVLPKTNTDNDILKNLQLEDINLDKEEDLATSTDKSNLNLNLIIFLLFLVAVILWIIWVNKELVKEKQQSEEENSDNESNTDKN